MFNYLSLVFLGGSWENKSEYAEAPKTEITTDFIYELIIFILIVIIIFLIITIINLKREIRELKDKSK